MQIFKLYCGVKEGMTGLATEKPNAARCVSLFVGIGALLVSLILRIGGMVEPIIGMVVDIFVAIFSCNSDALKNFGHRFVHLWSNIVVGTYGIANDIYKLGLVAGIGGINTPETAYDINSYA